MLSVALLQDIAAIPILALLPLLAVAGGAAADGGSGWWGAAKAVGVIAADRARRPAAAAPGAALDRAQRHARDLHRRVAAAGGGHRGADAERWACRWRWAPSWPACCWPKASTGASWKPTSSPSRACCSGLFFIAVGMSIDFAVVLAQPGAGGGRGARLPAAEGAGAVGDGARDAAAAGRAAGVRDPAGAGRRVRLRRLPGRRAAPA